MEPGAETGEAGSKRVPSPVRADERFEVLDILRGVAILGILAANLEFFRASDVLDGYPGGYEQDLGIFGRVFFVAVEFLASGKFITALAFLLGLGLALQYRKGLSSGRTVQAARRFLLKRLAVLALFGAAHTLLVWSGDVLLFYASLALPFSLLFVHRRPKTLVIWAACILGALTLLGLGITTASLISSLGESTPERPSVAPAPAFHSELARSAEEAYGEGSYLDQIRQRVREYSTNLALSYLGSGTQVLAMLMLGAAVVNAGWVGDRGGLGRRARRAALFGLTAGVPLNLLYALSFEFGPQEEMWYFYLTETAWYVGAPIMALGWMGLVALLFSRSPAGFVRLSAVGRMALTNYLAQSIILTSLFYGFGLYGRASVGFAVGAMFALWALELFWSRPWLARFRFGPAEWLWRRLTYGRGIGRQGRPLETNQEIHKG